ncbi:hypothetical protein LINPERHAP2_LOCUS23329 [Linum perenne]
MFGDLLVMCYRKNLH